MSERCGATKRASAIRMDRLPELEHCWLWPERIPVGNLTLLAGEQDAGKSRVAWDLATRASRGNPWPDDTANLAGAGSVLLVSSKNDSITARPALMSAGADMAKIRCVGSVCEKDEEGNKSKRPFDLKVDLDVLEQMILALGDCRLVIIDSISAFLGSGGGAKTAELLRGLLDLADRYQLAVVGVTHLRKGNGEALSRVVGGLTLTAAARCVWSVIGGASPSDRRLFLPLKNNLSAERMGLTFELAMDAGHQSPRVAWSKDGVEATADETFAALRASLKEQPKAVQRAMEFLQDALKDGPRLVKELEAESKKQGISQITLRRARVALEVRKFREAVPGRWWVGLREVGGEKSKIGGQDSEGVVNAECESEERVEHVADNCQLAVVRCQKPEESECKHERRLAQPPQPRPFSPGVPEEKGAEVGLTEEAVDHVEHVAENAGDSVDSDEQPEDHVERVGATRWNLANLLQMKAPADLLLCGTGSVDRHESGKIEKMSIFGKRSSRGTNERRRKKRERKGR